MAYICHINRQILPLNFGFIVPVMDTVQTIKKKPGKRGRGKSTKDIVMRQQALSKIISNLEKNDTPITKIILISEMKKRGYNIEPSTLYRDRTALNRNNSFIRDLTESNYSQYLQEIFNTLDFIAEQARIQYEKKWTASKTVTKTTADGEITEIHTTEELAGPKASFLMILAKVAEQKAKLLTGDPVQLSVALLSQKFQSMKLELAEVTNEKHTK